MSMLGQGDIAALLAARHPDPFAVLGLHADDAGKLWIRALLPGATSVELVDVAGGLLGLGLALRRRGPGHWGRAAFSAA